MRPWSDGELDMLPDDYVRNLLIVQDGFISYDNAMIENRSETSNNEAPPRKFIPPVPSEAP